MNIKWKQITNKSEPIINEWLSEVDRQNLCMTQKGWAKTAQDIEECLNIMPNSQFKNIIGYINDKPIVAIMFGIEQIKVLNLYNIVVNPKFRNMGVAKKVINMLLNNHPSFNLTQNFNKVVMSTLPQNTQMHNLLASLNFKSLGFNGEYVEHEKQVQKSTEAVL